MPCSRQTLCCAVERETGLGELPANFGRQGLSLVWQLRRRVDLQLQPVRIPSFGQQPPRLQDVCPAALHPAGPSPEVRGREEAEEGVGGLGIVEDGLVQGLGGSVRCC